jgi:hypothetical protein
VENIVISLSAKGLTTGEISSHLREIYGAEVSKQTISTITEKVMQGMAEWQNRPLDAVYPVPFLDCVNVKNPGRERRQLPDLRRDGRDRRRAQPGWYATNCSVPATNPTTSTPTGCGDTLRTVAGAADLARWFSLWSRCQSMP